MKGLKWILLVALVVAVGFGIKTWMPSDTSEQTEIDASDAVVVGSFATHDKVISVYTKQGQNLYSVASTKGETLSELLDESAFEREFPELHAQFKTGIAEIWAGLDLEIHSTPIQGSGRTRPLLDQLAR